MTRGGRTPRQTFEYALTSNMCAIGFDEIQTFSFISPKYYEKINLPENKRRSVVISNPLGEDTSVMRTTALPSMLEILSGNASFNNQNVKLWELATVYLPKESANELPEEKKCMTLGMYGNCDFFTLKAVCDKVLIDAGIAETEYTACEDNPSYHPGRCALVTGKNGETLAVLGQIHPTVADNYGFSAPVFCAEIDLEAVFNSASKKIEYKPLPKFPASTRDFSFVCEDALEVGKIAKIMKRAGGKLTENVELFDIYRGPQVGEGKKSVSMRVTLRAADRTLTVEEVEKVSAKILRSLENDLGITLRG